MQGLQEYRNQTLKHFWLAIVGPIGALLGLGLSVLGVIAMPWWFWAGMIILCLFFAQYRAFRDVSIERDKLRPIKTKQDALGRLAGIREVAVQNLLNRWVGSHEELNKLEADFVVWDAATVAFLKENFPRAEFALFNPVGEIPQDIPNFDVNPRANHIKRVVATKLRRVQEILSRPRLTA